MASGFGFRMIARTFIRSAVHMKSNPSRRNWVRQVLKHKRQFTASWKSVHVVVRSSSSRWVAGKVRLPRHGTKLFLDSDEAVQGEPSSNKPRQATSLLHSTSGAAT